MLILEKEKDNYEFISFSEKFNIIIKGIIKNITIEYIFSVITNNELEKLKQIDGSFLLIVADKRYTIKKYYVITDQVNSFKFFYSKTNNGWHITDDIDSFNKENFKLNPQAIACYLANGNMLNGLTLFKDIHMSEGACIYTFENDNLKKEKYWNISFSYNDQYTKNDEKEFKQELESVLIKSVKQNLSSAGEKLLISLSAGYDARSVLGLIKKIDPQKRTDTFTYRPTEKIIKNSDADISEKISKKYADIHYGLKSFNGNFLSTLILNAQEGKCLTNFCDELDAIKKLIKISNHTDVFAGDEWFGRQNVPLNSNTDLLDSVSIVGSWGIKWLDKVLIKSNYELFVKELDHLTNEIINETEKFSNQHDKKDFLYLHQRVNHVNLTWREYFTSQIGFVHNPYLSKEILEFYQRIPPEYRIEKKLFIETITEMLPDIFKIPIANERRSLSGINYKNEILKNKYKIIDLINNSSSYLDTFVTKQEIIKAIDLLETEKKTLMILFSKNILKIINALRRLYKPIDKFFYPIMGPRTVKIPDSAKIILRLLLLWFYLIKQETNVKRNE